MAVPGGKNPLLSNFEEILFTSHEPWWSLDMDAPDTWFHGQSCGSELQGPTSDDQSPQLTFTVGDLWKRSY